MNAVLGNAEFGGVPLDTKRVGLAGHSLSGYTVLGLAGGWVEWKDTRIKAVLAFSPCCSPYLTKGQLANLNIPVEVSRRYAGFRRNSDGDQARRSLRPVIEAQVLR